MHNNEIYPCTIISDRYTGAYSRGKWLAFPLDEEYLPYDISGGDGDCNNFWENYRKQKENGSLELHKIIGLGETPNKAYDNLRDEYKRISETITVKYGI